MQLFNEVATTSTRNVKLIQPVEAKSPPRKRELTDPPAIGKRPLGADRHRSILCVGAGNAAMRIGGERSQQVADFDQHLDSLRPMLKGQETLVRVGDEITLRAHTVDKDPERLIDRSDPRLGSPQSARTAGGSSTHRSRR